MHETSAQSEGGLRTFMQLAPHPSPPAQCVERLENTWLDHFEVQSAAQEHFVVRWRGAQAQSGGAAEPAWSSTVSTRIVKKYGPNHCHSFGWTFSPSGRSGLV